MKIRQYISNALLVTILLGSLAFAGFAEANTRVRGYTTKNGTYVQPYIRTSPNSTKFDNFSTKGNVNPYTGKAGTVNPFKAPVVKKAPIIKAPIIKKAPVIKLPKTIKKK